MARALSAFGAPPRIVRALESAAIDEFVVLGRPPFRIDLLQSVLGVSDFDAAHGKRIEVLVDDVEVSVISLDDLLSAKRAAGRPQDLADFDHLERIRK